VPDALCWSDGTITLTTAFVETLNPMDDELAFVIGHEMAHAIRRHCREQGIRTVLLGLGSVLTSCLFGRRVGDWTWMLGHLACQRMSRREEQEADRLGMCIAANAGYDPEAALSILARAAPAETRMPLDWLSAHPPRRERLRHIQANLKAGTSNPEGQLNTDTSTPGFHRNYIVRRSTSLNQQPGLGLGHKHLVFFHNGCYTQHASSLQ
jgi:predicted Zn-dependent protease